MYGWWQHVCVQLVDLQLNAAASDRMQQASLFYVHVPLAASALSGIVCWLSQWWGYAAA